MDKDQTEQRWHRLDHTVVFLDNVQGSVDSEYARYQRGFFPYAHKRFTCPSTSHVLWLIEWFNLDFTRQFRFQHS